MWKTWAAFRQKWAHLRTFYRLKLLTTIEEQLVWRYSGDPNCLRSNPAKLESVEMPTKAPLKRNMDNTPNRDVKQYIDNSET